MKMSKEEILRSKNDLLSVIIEGYHDSVRLPDEFKKSNITFVYDLSYSDSPDDESYRLIKDLFKNKDFIDSFLDLLPCEILVDDKQEDVKIFVNNEDLISVMKRRDKE